MFLCVLLPLPGMNRIFSRVSFLFFIRLKSLIVVSAILQGLHFFLSLCIQLLIELPQVGNSAARRMIVCAANGIVINRLLCQSILFRQFCFIFYNFCAAIVVHSIVCNRGDLV